MTEIIVECPKCHNRFGVEEVIKSQIENTIKNDYDRKINDYKQIVDSERAMLEKQKSEIGKQRQEIEEMIQSQLNLRLNSEREQIGRKFANDYEEKLKMLELDAKSAKEENLTLKRKEIELLQTQQKLNEMKQNHELEMEKKLMEQRNSLRNEIESNMSQQFELQKRELEKKLDDQRKLAEEMRRKAEQGSMQMQGEVQELFLEEFLAAKYPRDLISEVPKGKSGADIIHTVRNPMNAECGKIAYESKRTLSFNKDWIGKLKEDMIAIKADLGVIVTQNMPQGVKSFCYIDGIWVCSFGEFESVVAVLREMLLSVNQVKLQETNKSDAKEMIYNYLTSNEFNQRVTQIVDTFNKIRDGINKERTQMTKIWAMREKQIESIVLGMSEMFGSIKGYGLQAIEETDFMMLETYEEKED
ncbi:MAG: hypothetical protein CVV22_04670 [Ignavibacteriae bacterium HGW-Ignavibacteriae-1]|jgi:hypothetical protein|nr:MAG: hypothetical protein CVV22_04670 [Ignavibacteriae bacterium HGW-Ignavibacteriae-1]